MDFMTATKAWVARRPFSTSPDVDEATKTRLLDEIERLKARATEAKEGGGS